MDPHLLLALIFNAVLLATCGFAILRGGRPEKIGAAVNLLASGATMAARALNLTSAAPADAIVLLVDCAVAAAFFWLAIRTIRFWPVWAFGFALADLAISLAGQLIPRVPLFAYQTGIGAYAYLALASLALGTFRLPGRAERDILDGWRVPDAPL